MSKDFQKLGLQDPVFGAVNAEISVMPFGDCYAIRVPNSSKPYPTHIYYGISTGALQMIQSQKYELTLVDRSRIANNIMNVIKNSQNHQFNETDKVLSYHLKLK